jgi:hypothetical protein
MSNSETAAHLRSATEGFDSLFANQIGPAREAFTTNDSPFHLLGLGVCSFLEAALGMEVCIRVHCTAGVDSGRE